MSDFRLLINGRFVQGAGTLDVINPATGRTLMAAPRADRAQLEQAVAAAKAAFPTWSATPRPSGQRTTVIVVATSTPMPGTVSRPLRDVERPPT